MPSKKKDERNFGDLLEGFLGGHPKLAVFVLLAVFAFTAGSPFMLGCLDPAARDLVANVREAVMNVTALTSVLLGFYAIHQATLFRRWDEARRAEDDRQRKRETEEFRSGQRNIEELVWLLAEELEKATGAMNSRNKVKESKDDSDGDGLSDSDHTQ